MCRYHEIPKLRMGSVERKNVYKVDFGSQFWKLDHLRSWWCLQLLSSGGNLLLLQLRMEELKGKYMNKREKKTVSDKVTPVSLFL